MTDNLRRNSIYSLVGFGAPTVVLFASYPLLLKALGKDGFGVFSIATTLGGMVAFLDFGFGAATIHYLAGAIAQGDAAAGRDTVRASLRFFSALGAGVGICLFLAAPWMVVIFKVPPPLQQDALTAFRISGVQVALVFQLNAFVAILKGVQLYRFSSMATASLAAMNYGGATVACFVLGYGLVGATVASSVAYAVVMVAAAVGARKVLSAKGMWGGGGPLRVSAFRRLLAFGSITTLNGLASMVVTQLPRYIVASLFGPATVTVYTVAHSVALRVHAASAAAAEAFFPFVSGAASLREIRRPYLTMLLGSGALAAVLMAPLLIGAYPLLSLWVGGELAEAAAPLLRVFAVAFFVIALSPAPFYLANGLGRPHRNTVFILGHLVLYLVFVTALVFGTDLGLLAVGYGQLAANVVAVGAFLYSTERLFLGSFRGSPHFGVPLSPRAKPR
jgi:O-antigen/teichoic acid export membrane protein